MFIPAASAVAGLSPTALKCSPILVCLKIYDDNKSEGWFVHRDKLEFGGWDWIACDYLPNGYEGYYAFIAGVWREIALMS